MAGRAEVEPRRRQEVYRAARVPARQQRSDIGDMELHPAAGLTAGPAPLAAQRKRLRSAMMPPLNRTPMAPRPWMRRTAQHTRGHGDTAPAAPPAHGTWHTAAVLRRTVLFSLALTQTWLATDFMASVLPYQGRQPVEIAILILFAILFGWISAGFWTAMAGFVVLWTRHDHYAISATAAPDTRLDET